VLPWAQFLYAEGAADIVRAVFSMHDVVVTGCGLDALLADFAAQVVTVLQQPPRAEHSGIIEPVMAVNMTAKVVPGQVAKSWRVK
jgi:hypothetical protein